MVLPYKVEGNYLSFDANYYLEYAELFKEGKLIQMFLEGNLAGLGVWPLGFPILIGGLSFILGTDIFLSARILQALFLLVFVVLFKEKFKLDWLFYFSLISTGMFLSNFLNTLTEAGFILLGFGFLVILEKEKSLNKNVLLLLIPLLLFSFRYIGIFVFLFLIIYWWFIERKRIYLISALFLMLYAVLYFYFIRSMTGHYSGIERKGGIVDKWELFKQFVAISFGQFSYFDLTNFQGKAGELMFFIGLIPFMVLLVSWFRLGKKFKSFALIAPFSRNSLLFGSTYLFLYFFLTVGMGWDHDGEGISSRFVFPGIIFIMLGLFHQVALELTVKMKHRILLLSFSYLANIYYLISGLYFSS
jgi:hypothetical protein